MTLQGQETEIPLTLGMATKPSSELQEPTHMRLVENLHWRGLGEIERRPAADVSEVVPAPSGSAYNESGAYGFVVRGDSPVMVTAQHGLVTYSKELDRFQWARPATQAASAPDAALCYCPVNYEVTRQFVERTQFNKKSFGVLLTAAAQHNGVHVIAWLEGGNAQAANRLWVKAIDRETGTVVATREYVDATLPIYKLGACQYTEVGKEGVLIAYSTGLAGPKTVKTIRYDYASNAFIPDADLSTNANEMFTITRNGSRIFFAYEKNSTTLLTVEDRTITTVTTTHTGTHAAKASEVVVSTGRSLVISCTDTTAYAEVFGSPASAVAALTASSETFFAVTGALEDRVPTDHDAVLWVNAYTSVRPFSARLRSVEINFAAATPVLGAADMLPHSTAVARGFTLQGRAHVALGVYVLAPGGWVASDSLYASRSQPLLVARYRGHSTTRVRHDAVAKVCHDRFFRANEANSGAGIDPCVHVDPDNNAWFLLTADPAEDSSYALNYYPQTVFLERISARLPAPMAFASPEAGVVFSAGALPWEYDGDAPLEAAALVRPMLTVNATEGTGQTGSFSVVALYRWTDAAGRLHRMAGDAVAFTCTNKQIDVYVSLCPMRSYDAAPSVATSIAYMEPEIYITGDQNAAAPDPTHYLANDANGNKLFHSSITADGLWWKFTAVVPAQADKRLTLGIFTGAEVAPEPLPPFLHVAKIADRIWAVDAEDRSRIWYSKPLVTGFGAEWSASFTVTIGDEAVAIVDVGGVPTVLARGGIYQIGGPGPDATGLNGSFSPAVKLPYAVECIDPASVCRTPIGAVFRGRRGLYALADGPSAQPGLLIDPEMLTNPELDPGATASYRLRVVYQEQTNEIHCMTPVGGRLVYNTVEQKWSVYNEGSIATRDLCVARSKLWRLDNVPFPPRWDLVGEALYSATGAAYNSGGDDWRIDTPWYRLDQVNGQARLWRALFALRLASDPQDSEIEIRYYTDWGETTGQTVVWSGSELQALAGAGDMVVRLPFVPTKQLCTSFKFSVRSTALGTTSHAKPLSMRLQFGTRPSKGKQTRAQVKG